MNISKDELRELNPYISLIEVQGFSWDELGQQIDLQQQGFGAKASASMPTAHMAFHMKFPKDFWSALKKELRILVCTEDDKYQELRKRISSKEKTATVFIVSTISAYLAPVIGTTAAALSPLVGIALYGMVVLGKNAWCSTLPPLENEKKGSAE